MSSLTQDVWTVSELDFPSSGPIQMQLRFLLRYAILAPSVKNTQPWRFAIEENRVRIFADPDRVLHVTDPNRRELYISLGCALENLLVAAEHFGFRHEVFYFPEGEASRLVASVTLTPGGEPSLSRSGIGLDAITRRHNDNSVYRDERIPDAVRHRLGACREETEFRLILIEDRDFRRQVDKLTLEADRIEFANPEFRKELAHWIGEGVFGKPGLMSRIGGLVVSRLDLGEPVAQQDRKIVESAALLGLIAATRDTNLVHLRVGQLFQRTWLTATGMGVSIHPMSQTMRLPELRAAVAELLPAPGWLPQHLFRVGFSSRIDDPGHTPRRPLDEVLQS